TWFVFAMLHSSRTASGGGQSWGRGPAGSWLTADHYPRNRASLARNWPLSPRNPRRRTKTGPDRSGPADMSLRERGSVPRGVHQLVLGDPGHHGAKALADLLDGMLGVAAARGLEAGLAGVVLQHPVADEAARLDVLQHPLHLGLGLRRDDPRAGDVLAVLRGVGDRVVHVGDAALVDEVDDQLHLVQALEIGHLRGVTGLDQRLETHADEFDQAAAEDRLFAEEVGLALLLEGSLDDAGEAAAATGAIRLGDLEGGAGGVIGDRDEAGNTTALEEFATDGVAGALREIGR